MTVAVLVLLVVVAAVVAATVVVRTNKRKFAEANEVVPGTATTAPAAWAGAHNARGPAPPAPARRRRRRPGQPGPGGRLHDGRPGVAGAERLAVDQRLIAVAALPESVRAGPMASVSGRGRRGGGRRRRPGRRSGGKAGLDEAMSEVADRVSRLAQEG